jgi:hypothetical protein
MLCRGGASCERDFQHCWFPILSSRSLFPVRASDACACPASFFILSPNVFLVWGSEARCSRAPSPTVCSAGHGRCSRGAWEMRRKNSGSFVAAVLGLLFVGRCGPPQLVSSPKGGGSAAGGLCVCLGEPFCWWLVQGRGCACASYLNPFARGIFRGGVNMGWMKSGANRWAGHPSPLDCSSKCPRGRVGSR